MNINRLTYCFAFFSSILCLGIGSLNQNTWILNGLILLWLISWFLPFKWPNTRLITAIMVFSIALSIIELCIGTSSVWIILACSLSLAAWTLGRLDIATRLSADPRLAARSSFKQKIFLFGAISLGTLIAVLNTLIQLQLSFLLELVLIIFFVFCLDRIWRLVML